MFTNRSKAAFVGAFLGVAYAVYSVWYWIGATADVGSDAEAFGAAIATALVLPHMLVTVLGAIFAVIGFFTRKAGLTLTGAILFSVAAVLFFLYAAFLIPSIVLGFVGYANQKKINKGTQS
jgi:hypothetical protein